MKSGNCTDTAKPLITDTYVFWRYKGDRDWKRGHVLWVKGRMAEITHSGIYEAVVRMDEIEWEPND